MEPSSRRISTGLPESVRLQIPAVGKLVCLPARLTPAFEMPESQSTNRQKALHLRSSTGTYRIAPYTVPACV
jgi:hypothetical protein